MFGADKLWWQELKVLLKALAQVSSVVRCFVSEIGDLSQIHVSIRSMVSAANIENERMW